MVFARLRLAARNLHSLRETCHPDVLSCPPEEVSVLAHSPRIRIALALLSLANALSAAAAEESKLLLATTTSVQDTGLLDALLPVFRERTGIVVQVVAVGSGAALRMGADGNADVIVSHDPKGEQELVASGAALGRTPIMENYFVIAGPREDPAKVAATADPAAAFRAIAAAKAPYISRGDDSGTHRKEKQLLAAAGLDAAKPWEGFTSTGAGMGLTLQVAGERRGYVLSDIGTYLAYRERTKLVRLTKDTPALRNEYAVLRISPKRFPKLNAEAAQRFEAFLVDPDTQRRIGEFGQDRYGAPLFNSLRATTPAPAKSPPAQ
jgi:tungstate transport system substrate-binding protein